MKSPYSVIKNVVLTEKSSGLLKEQSKYLFQIDKTANKIDVKRAVEELYKVTVTGVNTFNRNGKRKRERSMRYGRTADTKLAVVTLKSGDTIDLV